MLSYPTLTQPCLTLLVLSTVPRYLGRYIGRYLGRYLSLVSSALRVPSRRPFPSIPPSLPSFVSFGLVWFGFVSSAEVYNV